MIGHQEWSPKQSDGDQTKATEDQLDLDGWVSISCNILLKSKNIQKLLINSLRADDECFTSYCVFRLKLAVDFSPSPLTPSSQELRSQRSRQRRGGCRCRCRQRSGWHRWRGGWWRRRCWSRRSRWGGTPAEWLEGDQVLPALDIISAVDREYGFIHKEYKKD